MNKGVLLPGVLVIVCFICYRHVACSQARSITSLHPGDSFPAVSLYDWNHKPVTTDERLVIYDFWNIHCLGCIQSMPRLDSLQKTFEGRMKIVLITQDSLSAVTVLFKKIKMPVPNLPMVVSDTLMNRYFPHEGDPLDVWVMNGEILYVSNGWSVTDQKIKDVLDGKDIDISNRLPIPDYEPSKTTLLTEHLPIDRYSLFLNGLHNYASGRSFQIKKDSVSQKPYYIKASNQPLLQLFAAAYWNDLFGFEMGNPEWIDSRMIVDQSIATELKTPTDKTKEDFWREHYLFSYEARVPAIGNIDVFEQMQTDLAKFFGYKTTIKNKVMDCLVLTIVDEKKFNSIMDTSAGPPSRSYHKGTLELRRVNLLNSLINMLTLAHPTNPTPIIDGTGYRGNVHFKLYSSDLFHIPILQKHLQELGLDLLPGRRMMKELFIKRK